MIQTEQHISLLTELLHKGNVIERATFEDIPALVELINEAYSVEESFKLPERSQRISSEQLSQEIANGTLYVMLNHDLGKGIPLGCALFRGATKHDGSPHPENSAYLGLLAVRKDMQGLGLGEKLVKHVEQQARSAGFEYVHIQVTDQSPRLQAWYMSHFGFEVVGTKDWYIPGVHKFPCKFIYLEKSLYRERAVKPMATSTIDSTDS